MFNYQTMRSFLEHAGTHYAGQSGLLEDWIDDVYIRLAEAPDTVTVYELNQVQALFVDGEWEHHNYATNRAYKCMTKFGRLPSNATISF